MHSPGFSVLYVDDELKQNNAMIIRLKSEGFTVTAVDNAKEALGLIKSSHYDILVSDYFMPEMTGENLIKEVRLFNRRIFIILQTAYANEKSEIEMMDRLEINAYYDKEQPVNSLLVLLKLATRTLMYLSKNEKLSTELAAAKEAVLKAREDNKILKEQARMTSLGCYSSDIVITVKDMLSHSLSPFRHAMEEDFAQIRNHPEWQGTEPYLKFIEEELYILEFKHKHIIDMLDEILIPKTEILNENSKFKLSEVLSKVDTFLNENAPGTHFRKNFCDTNMEIIGNPLNLTQVLITLLSRAVKSYSYTPKASIHRNSNYMKVDFKIEKKANNLLFTIRDYGTPLTKEEIADPSKQMIVSSDNISRGMGIYAAYSVVLEEYEGNIWCEAPDGDGTAYYISIPYV